MSLTSYPLSDLIFLGEQKLKELRDINKDIDVYLSGDNALSQKKIAHRYRYGFELFKDLKAISAAIHSRQLDRA